MEPGNTADIRFHLLRRLLLLSGAEPSRGYDLDSLDDTPFIGNSIVRLRRLLFGERNLRAKFLDLLLILAGMVLLYIGSH